MLPSNDANLPSLASKISDPEKDGVPWYSQNTVGGLCCAEAVMAASVPSASNQRFARCILFRVLGSSSKFFSVF